MITVNIELRTAENYTVVRAGHTQDKKLHIVLLHQVPNFVEDILRRPLLLMSVTLLEVRLTLPASGRFILGDVFLKLLSDGLHLLFGVPHPLLTNL